MCAGKQKGIGLLSVRQDGGADPLWVVCHGYSAGPVGHAGVESVKHAQTQIIVNW